MARRKKKSFMAARRRGGSTGSPLLRKALTGGIIAFAALLLLGFIGYAQLLSYLQGDEFRSVLQKELMDKAHANDSTMKGTLSIDANRVSLQALTLHWRSGMLQKLAGKSIHAEIKRSALLDKKLHLTRLMVEEGSLSLDLDRKGEKRPEPTRGKAGFLSRLAPTSAELERFDCKDFNATLRHGGKEYSLADSALSATPLSGRERGGWEIRLSNGRLHTPLPVLGDSSLKAATLTWGSRAATLSDARLMLSPGELIIDAVREQADGNWSADVRANSVDIARLIGEDWKKRLSGMLYGRLHADGNAEGLQQAEGRLSLQQGVLEALPFLEHLPVGNSYPYRHLRLEKATARLSYPHEDSARNIRNAWLLDQIDIRAEGGYLRVQGHAFVDADGSLGGSLLIGLPDSLTSSLIPAGTPLRQSIFNATGDAGYQWLRLNLSGSLAAPQEDLSVRLKTLLMGNALPEAANTLRELLLPRKTTTPAGAAPANEADKPASPAGSLIKEAGDAAEGIIGAGLRSLF